MTPIKPVSKTETKNYGQEPVNEFWLEIPASASSDSQDKKYLDHIKTVLYSVEDGVICVFSKELSSKPLCKEALANARNKGNRIYILTNDYHSEMKNLEGCLIRYGGNKKLGSFILINPNSNEPTGCLFTGRLSEEGIILPANLLLDLDNAQVSTLFRYFCYQFWNKAEKERIGNEERDTGAAPLDIYPPIEDSCDFEYLKSVWNKETENAMITTSLLNENAYLRYSNFSNSTIISLLSGIDDSLVRSLKQKNNKIYIFDDVTLINSLRSPDGIWLIPKTDSAREEEIYSIKLNSEQAELLNNHIKALSQGKTKYRYFTNEIREKLSGQTIFFLGDSVSQKFKINAESSITVQPNPPSELLPKEDFENRKPAFTDDGRSVSITYEWTNIPFTLPSGSKKHQLYKDWENAENDITAYIVKIQKNISDIENSGNKLSKLLYHLFLGKKQLFSEYKNKLDELKGIKYSTLKSPELRGKIDQIDEIRISVEKDTSEISEENRKAGIKEQIGAKEDEKKKREDGLKEKETELKETEEKIKTLSDGLKELEKQPKEKTEEKEIKNANKEIEDKKVKKKKIEDDIDKLKNQIKNVTNEISDLNAQLKKPVKEEKSEGSTLLYVLGGGKTPSQSGQVKELSDSEFLQFLRLPHTGELFQHNGQDYLAITNWEEYDEGKKEAERLNAKLCAKGENNG
jgi:hypothetical protein